MASYLNQPDSGGNCCDCPDRASPCDDCTATCVDGDPNVFCATFSGITFNCGCVHIDEFIGDVTVTGGDINGGYIVTWESPFNWAGANDFALYDYDRYTDDAGCSGDALPSTNQQLVAEIWCLEDHRFQILLSEGGKTAFWGTASSFGVPVTNEIGDTIACGETFTITHPAAGEIEMHAMASGGTVILTDNCGACLTLEGTCFDNNAETCANAGGTFVPFEHCGKCCVEEVCSETSETGCDEAGGVFTRGDFCGTCP